MHPIAGPAATALASPWHAPFAPVVVSWISTDSFFNLVLQSLDEKSRNTDKGLQEEALGSLSSSFQKSHKTLLSDLQHPNKQLSDPQVNFFSFLLRQTKEGVTDT
jgi:hypothetical protein